MSTAGNSYEAWKESLMEAEPEGEEAWSAETASVASSCLSSIVDMKTAYTGMLLGVGLLIVGVGVLLPNFKHLTVGKRTVGSVVGYKDYMNRGSNSLVAPVIRYSAPGGVRDFVGGLSVASSFYPLGKEVRVLYLPKDPKNAVIFDFTQMFMIPTIVGGLGLICLTGTSVLMFLLTCSELPPDKAPAFSSAQTKPPPATPAPQTAESPASCEAVSHAHAPGDGACAPGALPSDPESLRGLDELARETK
jgi:Protein of unknown function (DUF3592)